MKKRSGYYLKVLSVLTIFLFFTGCLENAGNELVSCDGDDCQLKVSPGDTPAAEKVPENLPGCDSNGEGIENNPFCDAEESPIEWIEFFGSLDAGSYGEDIKVSSEGYVYSVGCQKLDPVLVRYPDAFLKKFDFDGNLVWERSIDTGGFDCAYGLDMDANSNIYVVGNNGSSAIFMKKFDTEGNQLFSAELSNSDIATASDICAMPDGSMVVSGWTYGEFISGSNPSGQEQPFIAQINIFGNIAWIDQYSNIGRATSVDCNDAGDVVVSGFYTTHGSPDIYVKKYSSSGVLSWSNQFSSSGLDMGYDVAIDKSTGQIYVVGTSEGNLAGANLGSRDGFLISLDEQGNPLWSKALATEGNDSVFGVTIDQNGNVLVTGLTTGYLPEAKYDSHSGGDLFVGKFNSSGEQQKLKQIGVSAHFYGNAIATSEENIFITGSTTKDVSEAGNVRGFVTKISLDGN